MSRRMSPAGPRKMLVLALALLSGCAPGGDLDLELVVAGQPLGPLGPAAQPGQPPEGMDAFRLCVQRQNGESLACQDFTDLGAARYRIGGLPTGEARVISFQGYTLASGEATWCGRAPGVDIRDGETASVRMLLTRCGDVTQTVGLPTHARMLHSATLTAGGPVLVAGGYDQHAPSAECPQACRALQATTALELYDPAAGTFAALAQGLTHPRGLHAALALHDGRVLLAGGCEVASLQGTFGDPDRPGSPLACLRPGEAATSLEIVDPLTGAVESQALPFTLFAAAMPAGPDALLLVGGLDEAGQPTRRALLVQVTSEGVVIVAQDEALGAPRQGALAIPFSSPGASPVEALVLGGSAPTSTDDPGPFAEVLVVQDGELLSRVPRFVDETFADGLPVMLAAGDRVGPGQVLATGGVFPTRFLSQDTPFVPRPLEAAGLADLRLDRLKMLDAEHRLLAARALHTCTAFGHEGRALVVGGFDARSADADLYYSATRTLEEWDQAEEGFSLRWLHGAPVELGAARAGHSATLLPDGTLLLLGGTDGTQVNTSAELWNPSPSTLQAEGLPAP
jgi:hypothetical protein